MSLLSNGGGKYLCQGTDFCIDIDKSIYDMSIEFANERNI